MIKDKMDKKSIIDFVKKYKFSLLSLILGVVLIVILLNLNWLQISFHKMNNQTQAVENILSKEKSNINHQSRAYFKSGMNYLIEKVDQEGSDFLETYFLDFLPTYQEAIILCYNEKNLIFAKQTQIIKRVAAGDVTRAYKEYFKRVDSNLMEVGLIECFGENIVLTTEVIEELANVSQIYPGGMPLERFRISFYELFKNFLRQTGQENSERLLATLDALKVKTQLFEELKTEPIDVDQLNEWVDILQKYEVIENTEYAAFTNSYSRILQIRDSYKQFNVKEVDLLNQKESIDLMTQILEEELETLEKNCLEIDKTIANTQQSLNQLGQYETIELYIMDYYGDNEYEASVPEKSWFFGTYKPSNQIVRIKLTATNPSAQGVFGLKVYPQGLVEGVPYYIEVSDEQLQEISAIKAKLQQLTEEKNNLIVSKEACQTEIEITRQTEGYTQILQSIDDLNSSRETVKRQLKEQQLSIQNLFGIGNLIIEIDK
jgi:hypothetical protein